MTEMVITEAQARRVLEVVDAGLVFGLGYPIPGQMCVEAAICFALGLPHGDNPGCVNNILRAGKISLNDCEGWSSKETRAQGMRRLALIQLGSTDMDDTEFVRKLTDVAVRKSLPFALRETSKVLAAFPSYQTQLIACADVCERDGNMEAAGAAYKVCKDAYRELSGNSGVPFEVLHSISVTTSAADHAIRATESVNNMSLLTEQQTTRVLDYKYTAVVKAVRVAVRAADTLGVGEPRDTFLSEFAEEMVKILVAMNVPGVQWLPLAPLAH